MMDYDTYEATRNNVDALLALASQMHHLAATSDLSEVCVQTRENKTVYDGTAVALEALLQMKWPDVPVDWLRDLWIDLLDVPTQADVESMVLSRLNREDATDPWMVASRATDEAMYAKYGYEDAYATASWTEARAAEAQAIQDRVYADATRQVEALAKDMSKPRA